MDYRNQQTYEDAVDMQQYLRWRREQEEVANNEAVIDPQLLEHDRRVLDTVGSWPNSEDSNLSVRQFEEDVDRGVPDVGMSDSIPAGSSQFSMRTVPSTNGQGDWQCPQTPKHQYQTKHPHNTLQQPTPDTSHKSQERPQNQSINQGYDEPWQRGNPFAALSFVGAQEYHTPAAGDAANEQCHTPVSQEPPELEFGAMNDGLSPTFAEAPTYHPYGDNQHLAAQQEQQPPANFQLWARDNAETGLPSENILDWASGTYHPVPVRDTVPEIPHQPLNGLGKGKGKGRPQTPATRSVRSGRSSRGTGTVACPVCGKTFDTKTKMNHHARIHGEPTKQCRFCDQRYHFQHHLDRHETSHTDERPCRCNHPGCKKRYKRTDHLKRHVVKKHPGPQ